MTATQTRKCGAPKCNHTETVTGSETIDVLKQFWHVGWRPIRGDVFDRYYCPKCAGTKQLKGWQ